MNIIALTNLQKEKILINLDYVINISPGIGCTWVVTTKEHYKIIETVDEVYELIKNYKNDY